MSNKNFKNRNKNNYQNNNQQTRKQVTGLDVLMGYQGGQVVELPPFAEGQPFVARMVRPSMLVMAKQGKIPNELLASAQGLFSGRGINENDVENALANMYDVCELIAEASLVEPTLADIKRAGLSLTDDQLIFIFSYAQKGVSALDSFRQEREDTGSDRASENL